MVVLTSRQSASTPRATSEEPTSSYVLRPPITQEHLTLAEQGLVAIQLKRPFRDGTVSVQMDPLSLVSRLAAAVHPPRFHSIPYGGVLAPHAQWRPFVIPPPSPATAASPSTEDVSHSLPMAKQPKPRLASHRCGYIPWQRLMRQLGIDVETCPRCGGKLKVIALVGPCEHRPLPAPPGPAHGRAVHGSRPWTTVLAKPRPASPLPPTFWLPVTIAWL